MSESKTRSEQFAIALSNHSPLPQEIATAFLNPIASEAQDASLREASETISELLDPRGIQASLSPIRLEHHQKLIRGLSRCLSWLYEQSPWDQDASIEKSALQAMLPLYWIPANESWEQQLNQSLHLLRRHAVLILWRDSLSHAGIQTWLQRPNHEGTPLLNRIENSFRICLSHLSYCYWNGLASQGIRSQLPATLNSTPEWESDSWRLATALSENNSPVELPSSFGNSVWKIEEIRDHWHRLTRSLIDWNTNQCDPSSTLPTMTPQIAQRFVPIEDKNASLLSSSLSVALDRFDDESCLSLAVIRAVPKPSATVEKRGLEEPGWIFDLCNEEELSIDGMFRTQENDWVISYRGMDRSELARRAREAFEKLCSNRSQDNHSQSSHAFVAGIATVVDPTASFQIGSLIDGAWRCLEAAELQGPNAVKTIQVY